MARPFFFLLKNFVCLSNSKRMFVSCQSHKKLCIQQLEKLIISKSYNIHLGMKQINVQGFISKAIMRKVYRKKHQLLVCGYLLGITSIALPAATVCIPGVGRAVLTCFSLILHLKKNFLKKIVF